MRFGGQKETVGGCQTACDRQHPGPEGSGRALKKSNGAEKTPRRSSFPHKASTGDHTNFHRLDIDPLFFQPSDGPAHFAPGADQFQADDADFVRHAGLADVRHHLELVADLVDERLLDQLRRIHQPQALLRGRVRFRCRDFFLGGHKVLGLALHPVGRGEGGRRPGEGI